MSDRKLTITGGRIIDGTGKPSFPGNVHLDRDVISSIEPDNAAQVQAQTLDATGCLVTPGFIDAHSHSDTYILIEPSAPSKVFQGITTEVVGNCGASAAPLRGRYNMPSDWASQQYPAQWSTVAEYRELLKEAGPAVNIALLVGHNNLRAGIAGYENRPVSPDELAAMKCLLEESLEQGARGLSTGLIYPPGIFADRRELTELAGLLRNHDGIYTSHMRSEGGNLIEAIAETIEVGRSAGCRTEVSHLKAAGPGNWHLIDRALETIEAAREEGLQVCADRYPYTSGATDLDVVFPAWAEEGGRDAVIRRLNDEKDTARLRKDLLSSRTIEEWRLITIGSTTHPDNARFRGRRLTDAADELGLHPVDAILHLTRTDELKTGAFFFGMSEDNMARILSLPYVMLGSDASLRATSGALSTDYPHPRAYGTFPKFLRMVLDDKIVSMEEAVRKITSLPAEQFGLDRRGTIAKGYRADMVVFDPALIKDHADYGSPHQLSEGIRHLIVNGIVTIKDGQLTGQRGGIFV